MLLKVKVSQYFHYPPFVLTRACCRSDINSESFWGIWEFTFVHLFQIIPSVKLQHFPFSNALRYFHWGWGLLTMEGKLRKSAFLVFPWNSGRFRQCRVRFIVPLENEPSCLNQKRLLYILCTTEQHFPLASVYFILCKSPKCGISETAPHLNASTISDCRFYTLMD